MKNTPKSKSKTEDEDPLAGDLSDFISKAKWRKARFVFAPKDTTVSIRIPKTFVDLTEKPQARKAKPHAAI